MRCDTYVARSTRHAIVGNSLQHRNRKYEVSKDQRRIHALTTSARQHKMIAQKEITPDRISGQVGIEDEIKFTSRHQAKSFTAMYMQSKQYYGYLWCKHRNLGFGTNMSTCDGLRNTEVMTPNKQSVILITVVEVCGTYVSTTRGRTT